MGVVNCLTVGITEKSSINWLVKKLTELKAKMAAKMAA